MHVLEQDVQDRTLHHVEVEREDEPEGGAVAAAAIRQESLSTTLSFLKVRNVWNSSFQVCSVAIQVL